MRGRGNGTGQEDVARPQMPQDVAGPALEPHPTLSAEQSLAALYLAYSKTRREAAEAADVSQATIYRWLQRADFRGYLHELKRQRLGAVRGFLDEAHRTILQAAPRAAEMLVAKGVAGGDVTALNSILDRAGVPRRSSRDLNVRVRRETYESKLRQVTGQVIEGRARYLPPGDDADDDGQDREGEGEDREDGEEGGEDQE